MRKGGYLQDERTLKIAKTLFDLLDCEAFKRLAKRKTRSVHLVFLYLQFKNSFAIAKYILSYILLYVKFFILFFFYSYCLSKKGGRAH